MAKESKTYRAYCTHPDCGWVGSPQVNEKRAFDEGDDHAVCIADPDNIHDHHRIEVRS
jgi:hypothetical protein